MMGLYDDPAVARRVRAQRKLALRSTDPLGLTRSPAEREAAERARAALVREGGLGHLSSGKHPLPPRLFAAAAHLRWLWMLRLGNPQAIAWSVDRVDGGRRMQAFTPDGSASAADAELRFLVTATDMGSEAATCVLCICCFDMTAAAYASDIEDDPLAKANGGCSRGTLDYVRRLLKSGLSKVALHLTADGELIADTDSEVGSARRQIVAWMADGERPSMEATKLGPRPDLARPSKAPARPA
jgi:hypothetical protein